MTKAEPPNRIQALREAAGLTRAELAERVGVSRQLVTMWETKGVTPSLPVALALARELGVDVTALGFRAKEPPMP